MLSNRVITSLRHASYTIAARRNSSLLNISVDNEGIALVSLNRPPVNSLSLKFYQKIRDSIHIVEKNEYKGVVYTSALPNIFSSGMDLNELKDPDPERLRILWATLLNIFLDLYGSSTISTTAINGYSGAAATVFNLICDYRVMVSYDKARIGLNDTAVGIVPADWLMGLMSRVMGARRAEIALTTSTMYTTEEAFKVNLIDEIASDKEDAIEKCKKFIRRYDNIPRETRHQTKKKIRDPLIKSVRENFNENIEEFVQSTLQHHVQQHIAFYVQQIKQRKK